MLDTIDVFRVLPAWSVPPSRLTEDEFGAAAAEARTTPPDRYTTLEHLAMHERGMRDQLCVLMEAVAA